MAGPDQQVTAIKLRAILDRIAEMPVEEPQIIPAQGMPVDAIAVRQRAGFNLVSVPEWQALPADERKDAILDNRVIFLHREEPVPVRAALTWLKTEGR